MAKAEVRWPLFVTFTVQHDASDDWDLIRTVRRGMTKLRRQRWFKKAVRGGIDAFEAQNDKGGLHPHCHALFDCRWFAITVPGEIAEQWRLCVGRKGSIKVRRVWKRDGGDIGAALAEVIKYSVCGSDIAQMQIEKAVQLIRVLDRTRMLCSHGTLFRHPEIRRQKSAPAMCKCGAADWFPEALVDRGLVKSECQLSARNACQRLLGRKLRGAR
jgi:hypothetical protein